MINLVGVVRAAKAKGRVVIGRGWLKNMEEAEAQEEYALSRRYWTLRDIVKDKKIEVATAMKSHQEISKKVAELLLLRKRVSLLKESLTYQKQTFEKASKDLAQIRQSNNRKEEKLKRAKSRDLGKKYSQAKKECSIKEATLSKEKTDLFEMRRNFITQLMNRVFPLYVPTTQEGMPMTEGNEESTTDSFEYDIITNHLPPQSSSSSSSSSSISHRRNKPVPLHCIGLASLPANGIMRDYVDAVKLKNVKSQVTLAPDDRPEEETDPLSDQVLSVSAALSFVTHSVSIIARILDQALPYPLLLPVILCEYGRPDRKAQTIIRFLAKLDDNITFLCFTQNVPVDLLTVGHTLKNLSVLVEYSELGRNGPFTCHPELLHCSTVNKKHRMTREQNYTTPEWETEPPILHRAHQEDLTQEQPLDISAATRESDDDLCSQSDDSEDDDDDDVLMQGWEEVQDLMVPTRFFPGFHGERLEYGVSTAEISHQSVLNEVGGMHREESNPVQYSSGLLNTLSSLLGSAWTRQQQ
uniref:Uncharacterized protein n=2 Tax=Amphimedon queenslandica TaxID=400682 RepID=A0A1X7VES8_AMPQE